MHNRKNNINKILKDSVVHLTPNILDLDLTQPDSDGHNIFIIEYQKPKHNWLPAAGMAAACVLVLTGFMTYER